MERAKTTIPDIDVYRCANLAIKSYPDPVMNAATRYDELLDKGDVDGCLVWKRIGAAIKELLARKPDGAVH